MTLLRALLVSCFATLLLVCTGSATAQNVPKNILFVAVSPVPPGKFKMVKEVAAKYGLTVEAHFVERIPPNLADTLLDKRDAVIFDAGRAHMRDAVKRRLEKPLASFKGRHIWMNDEGPLAEGFSALIARRVRVSRASGMRRCKRRRASENAAASSCAPSGLSINCSRRALSNTCGR